MLPTSRGMSLELLGQRILALAFGRGRSMRQAPLSALRGRRGDWPAPARPARRAASPARGTSISICRSRATSTMFSATTVGRPSSSTWLTRYRFRSRLLASTIESTTSGGGPCPPRPSSTSTATISSGERGARLYVPGRSISSNVLIAVPQVAGLLLDGDAGIVADALPHAGQRREQRRLARVRDCRRGRCESFWRRWRWSSRRINHRGHGGHRREGNCNWKMQMQYAKYESQALREFAI